MLTVAVLGPVEVRRDRMRLVVPGGKTTEVLIRLALDAGELVRTEQLIEELWWDQERRAARNTLQAKVSRLRRALDDPELVMGSSAGYRLAVSPDRVDAMEVARLAQLASALHQAGDLDGAVHSSAVGLAMFHGDLVPDAGDADWVMPHRARLQEVRLALIETSLASRVQRRDSGELVGELESLVADHPLREGLWKLLITALYRAGRQADALAAYRRLRRRLDDDLGLDPSAELQALQQQVLRHDPGLDLPVSETATATAPPRGNLPALTSTLVGREPDLDAVQRLLDTHRLVSVIGVAGVGKTRLAIEVAREAPPSGGSWLVRLESASSPGDIWQSVGEAFGLTAAPETTVLDRLRGFELLLVLDNCEHLVGALLNALDRMLSTEPMLHILTTSQIPLDVDGEAIHVLEPLTIAESVVLFEQRAQQRSRTFRLDDSSTVVESICRSLDGLPLAIELAASRTKALSVNEIARRLEDRFTLLTDPVSLASPRRRTLHAAIAWSYDLLFPDDQRGLWAVSSFPGGAPLTAAEHVLGALDVPADALMDVFTRLADRSLVAVEVDPDGAVRYRLLDSVREFSIDRLRTSGLTGTALGGCASWFADAATDVAQGVRGHEQARHLSFVRTEQVNIDAALTWSLDHDPLLALRIVNGLGWAWAVLGGSSDAAQRVRAAVASARAVAQTSDVAAGLLLAGWLEASGGDLDVATADLDEAMRLGDQLARITGMLYLAFIRSQQARAEEALTLLAECRPHFHELGRTWEEGATWLLSAWAEIALGRTDRGKAACDEALRLLRPLGDQWALNHAEGMLGALAEAEHRFADATVHLQRAADATRQLGFASAEAHHLANLGWAQQQDGDSRAAITTLERAVDTAHDTGDLRTAALARARLALVLSTLGERAAAREAAESAQRWYATAGGGEGAPLADDVLAALDRGADPG